MTEHEHDFTEWAETLLGLKGWGDERQHYYAPARQCKKCGRAFYREPGEWRPASTADTLREMAPR